jgi:hypothetical protein
MPNIQLVPECFAETELVKVVFEDLVHDNRNILNHGEGIHQVSKILRHPDVKDYLNIGFIDNDKRNTPLYFDEFAILEETPLVDFKKHPSTNDYILIVKPAIERFILSQLEEIDKHPSNYGLPDNFKEFKKKLKSMRIQHHPGYKKMIVDLKKENTTGIRFMVEKIGQLVTLE